MAHNYSKIIVLLNGAKEKHISKSNYNKSRGLIVIELMTSKITGLIVIFGSFVLTILIYLIGKQII